MLALGLAACGPGTPPFVADDGEAAHPPPVAISPQDHAEAAAYFDRRCWSCHGRDGRGRGPVAAGLEVPPRDWTDRTWQATVTDRQLARTILEGGAAVGLSALMPDSRIYADRPGVIRALVERVRSFGR